MDETRLTILNSATALFAEGTFETVSVRDIATQANRNVALINYYFKNKASLYRECVLQCTEKFLNKPSPFKDLSLDTSDCLTKFYGLMVQAHREHNTSIILHDREMSNPQGSFRDEFFTLIMDKHLAMIAWLKHKSGITDLNKLQILAFSLVGIVKLNMMAEDLRIRFSNNQTISDEALIAQLVAQGTLMIKGLNEEYN